MLFRVRDGESGEIPGVKTGVCEFAEFVTGQISEISKLARLIPAPGSCLASWTQRDINILCYILLNLLTTNTYKTVARKIGHKVVVITS